MQRHCNESKLSELIGQFVTDWDPRCTPAAESQAGGYALGNQVSDERWAELLGEAGFTSFRRATETPFNRVFEVRP